MRVFNPPASFLSCGANSLTTTTAAQRGESVHPSTHFCSILIHILRHILFMCGCISVVILQRHLQAWHMCYSVFTTVVWTHTVPAQSLCGHGHRGPVLFETLPDYVLFSTVRDMKYDLRGVCNFTVD